MKDHRVPALPFAPVRARAAGVEVQRLDRRHAVRGMPPHAHDFFELVLIDEGSGVHAIEGTEHEAAAGSLFFLQPGQSHDCRRLGKAGGWLVLLSRPLVSPLLQRIDRVGRVAVQGPFKRRQRARWSERIEALAGEIASDLPERERAIHAHTALLLVDLLRGAEAPAVEQLAAGRDIVAEVLAAVDALFAGPATLDDVARALGRSPAHLTTFMRTRTGRTVGDCIIDRRMAEARKLLEGTGGSLERVAERCGYADVSAFTRRFRREHDLSPGAWRERARRR